MMILYEKTESNFNHNGLAVLDDFVVSPVVSEQLNGLFSLEFDYPIHAKASDKLRPEMIVKCPVPELQDQLFRIVERDDSIGGLLHIVAHHIFYDLAKNLIEDTYIVNKNGSGALTQLLGATAIPHTFTGTSNISTVNNVRLVRLNPVEVLLDADLDNGFQARYGGEIVRDNFLISILAHRGSDNGLQIRDKKNLTGYESDLDYSSIVTRIMPEGYEGLFLPEKYVDSPLINYYVSPKIKVIKYDNVKVGDEEGEFATKELAYAELRRLAAQEFTVGHIDLPTATYDVEFAPLERTEEYKDFASLETIYLGDTVSVIHAEDRFNVTARMVEYKYDPLLKAFISITLGSVMPKFTDVAKDIKKVDTKVEQVKDDANYALTAANGKNTNFYGPDTPANPKQGDVWYKENGDKLEMWVYETRDGVTQWYALSNDLTAEEVKQAVAQAQEESADALEKANSAFDEALTALENANQANSTANNASQVADSAFNKSIKSSSVTYAVGTSSTTAPTSGWQSTVPSVSASQYLWTRTVFTLQDNSTTTSYSVSKQGAKGDKGDKGDTGATGATGSPGANGTPGQNAPTITSVREQFYLSTSSTSQTGGSWSNTIPTWSNGKYYWTRVVTTYSDSTTTTSMAVLDQGLNQSFVTALEAKSATETLTTTVNQHATKIELAATNITNLQGRMTTAESTLTVQAGQIAAKASQTSVDSLTGRISSAEASLTVQAGQIASKASQSSVDGLTGRVTSAETLIQQTSNTMLLKVSELQDEIGVPFKVKNWEQGSLSTGDGSEISATNYIRSEYIDVAEGDKLIGQRRDGSALTVYYHYYGFTLPYVDYVPAAKQYVEKLAVGTYDNTTIVDYLNSKAVETLSITGSVTSNPYASAEDYLVIYKLPMGGRALPSTITWNGRKDTSDNIVLLYAGGTWQQIDTVTNSSNAIHTWNITPEQISGMLGDYVYIAFFAIRNGSYAGIYNATTSPFIMNPMDESAYTQISYQSSSGTVTVPTNALKLRVRVNTTTKPDDYDGNVFSASAREDYSKANTVYSAIMMQKDIINLRVGKGDVINQINISPESILIAGNKVHITGQTTIDNGIITSAMIGSAAITTAKIADAAITSAKIASLDAGKITTGTLSASRIAASSITADKLAANILTAITASSSIRITGTTIGYYSGSTLVTEINSQGMTIRRGGTTVGTIGANNISGHTDWRGLVFDLEYGTEYMAWAHKDSSGATSYTTKLIWYSRTLETYKEKGFHFDDDVWLNGSIKMAGGHTISFGGITFSSTLYTRIGSSTGDAGIAFNGSNLFIGDDGTWVDFGIIREICRKLAGRTIALPTGFNSNGTASGWYNPQAFNSMTTYG
ncbi:phage tail spike protein [Enterococcus faecalis]|uniref:phage tail spike protein n=2 Tax=Enterococcus TaxID=1350 RepID=UPI0024BF6A55|nr:phage tail spike protein [Enterococcus faecalis]MDK0488506.1 phage tail protein [Enterococcus faecalis]MDK0510386.1 phage tail protein [Enterococcus faecalis]